MPKISLELTEQEMAHLAEISAMVLSMLGQAIPDPKDKRANAWHRLCVSLLSAARGVPSIAKDMEMNPDCGYWFFKRAFIDRAFYSDVLDEYRDSTFWAELVGRVADQCLMENLGADALEHMSEEERNARVSTMEKALWNEVTKHGIDRLLFLIPPNEA